LNKGRFPGRHTIAKTLLLLIGVSFTQYALPAQPDEYTLKLVYLYNFTKFIRWDDNETDAPFNICIVGKLPSVSTLEKLSNKKSQNRPVHAIHLGSVDESDSCHILFLTKSASEHEVEKLARRPHDNTLVVGETNQFPREYGDVGFVIDEENHVRIEINLDHTQNKKLSIRAPLLEVARKIYRTDNGES